MTNPLIELQRLGQSPWHDNIRRGLLTSGTLQRMVADGDVTGLTSNPTIFEQAIASGKEYAEQLRALARAGKSADDIADALAIQDIRDAADVFAPVYRRTQGADGYVSIEVAPRYANDTRRSIAEAHRLWDAVDRPNLMVKIPGTAAGLPAIETCIADGLNINITLIFSLARYDEVMEAFLSGLERRRRAGKPLAVASVASFFVSRVDTAVDKLLDEMLATAPPDQAEQLKQLKGKAAIANAKLAYQRFRAKFADGRFAALAGARLQRPLWASTSTKNPAYPDLYYVEALVGPDTVDTMPPATITAYKDHGRPEIRIDRDLDDSRAVLQRLEDAGISMDTVTRRLEIDGVASFAKSYDSFVATVAAAVADMQRNGGAPARNERARRPAKRPAASGRTPKAAKSSAPTKRAGAGGASSATRNKGTLKRTRGTAARKATARKQRPQSKAPARKAAARNGARKRSLRTAARRKKPARGSAPRTKSARTPRRRTARSSPVSKAPARGNARARVTARARPRPRQAAARRGGRRRRALG
jgi:transaldolase